MTLGKIDQLPGKFLYVVKLHRFVLLTKYRHRFVHTFFTMTDQIHFLKMSWIAKKYRHPFKVRRISLYNLTRHSVLKRITFYTMTIHSKLHRFASYRSVSNFEYVIIYVSVKSSIAPRNLRMLFRYAELFYTISIVIVSYVDFYGDTSQM